MHALLKYIFNRTIWLYVVIVWFASTTINYSYLAEHRSRYLLGLYYNGQMKNWKNGVVYLDHLIRQNPNDAKYYAHTGWCYVQMRKYNQAVRYYQRALVLDPYEETYVNNLADLYASLGSNDLAQEVRMKFKLKDAMPKFKRIDKEKEK